MCGIVCALDLKQSSDLLRSQVLEMSKKVRHRGPDWNGIHCGKNVLLAHERLAIVDPASGNQPIYSDDRNLILAANGEIYNHQELRTELKTDYIFQTNSDCEIILALYKEKGVNFIDTAELYPVPATAETQGRTSKFIGTWLKKNNSRDKVVIASKIAGPGEYTAHIRTTGFSADSIKQALDLELKRLQTDYIDLYQLHWPERHTNTFGVRDFKPSPNDPWVDNFNDVLHTLKSFVDAGKIRAIGLSNEKAWGAMRCAEEIRKDNLVPISTTQNAYSMLNRVFEGDLAG